MHNSKIVNSSKMTTSRSVYPFPLLFRRLSTVFFIDSETNETIPLHFRNVFHFFSKKNSLSESFLIECVQSGAASCNKRREFWPRNSHTSVASDWMYHFSHTWKTSFAILIGCITFFTCENHCSLLWLARTNLRTKVYDIAFWWVFLSMYIIKPCTAMYRHVLPCIATYSYVLPCIAMYCHVLPCITMHYHVSPCIAM